MEGPLWLTVGWSMLDASMRRWSAQLQRILRLIRITYAALIVGVLLVLASAVVGLVWPQWFPIAYAIAVVFLVLPLAILTILVGLPLRAKSVTRLVDKGYPANAKELAIRLMARKLHEQSIETEELLVDTALNEARKAWRRVKTDTANPGAGQPHGNPSTPPPPTGPGNPSPPGAPPA